MVINQDSGSIFNILFSVYLIHNTSKTETERSNADTIILLDIIKAPPTDRFNSPNPRLSLLFFTSG